MIRESGLHSTAVAAGQKSASRRDRGATADHDAGLDDAGASWSPTTSTVAATTSSASFTRSLATTGYPSSSRPTASRATTATYARAIASHARTTLIEIDLGGEGHRARDRLLRRDAHPLHRSERREPVGWMTFRVLKFKPIQQPAAAADADDAGGGRCPASRSRMRPPLAHDNAWWWEGVDDGKLLIQKCRRECGTLRGTRRGRCALEMSVPLLGQRSSRPGRHRATATP